MPPRLKNTLYTVETIKNIDGHLSYVTNEDGTLFSGSHKTKIKPEDLPAWYIYGRYYKRFGYMSTKGITDLMYIPNRSSNHFLKDDCLLIAYDGSIKERHTASDTWYVPSERYEGWNERVYGNAIIAILRGAREHSGYDIAPLIEQLKQKKAWLQERYPEEFGSQTWNIDVDRLFDSDMK